MSSFTLDRTNEPNPAPQRTIEASEDHLAHNLVLASVCITDLGQNSIDRASPITVTEIRQRFHQGSAQPDPPRIVATADRPKLSKFNRIL